MLPLNSINKQYIHLNFLELLFVIHKVMTGFGRIAPRVKGFKKSHVSLTPFQSDLISNVDDPKQFKLETNQTRLKAIADNVTIRC